MAVGTADKRARGTSSVTECLRDLRELTAAFEQTWILSALPGSREGHFFDGRTMHVTGETREDSLEFATVSSRVRRAGREVIVAAAMGCRQV